MASLLDTLDKLRQKYDATQSNLILAGSVGDNPGSWHLLLEPFKSMFNKLFDLTAGQVLIGSGDTGAINKVTLHGDITVNPATGQVTVNSTTAPVNAQPATTTAAGVVEMSVAPVSSATPIAVGDNDPRMSDQRTPLDGSVTTDKLADYAVSGAKLGNYIIESNHLDDDCVHQTNIASNAVGQNQIIDGAVIAGKIAAGAVGTAEIADGSITSAKLAAGVGGGGSGGTSSSTYAATIIADSPIVYYKLDEASGATSAADSSGNSHPATIGSTVQCGVPGPFANATTNKATYFDGQSTSIISATISTLPQGQSARAVECWFKATDNGDRIITHYGATASGQRWSLLMYQGKLISETYGSLHTLDIQAADWGQWHHVICAHDGTNAKTYLDGALVTNQAFTMSTNGTTFTIGGGGELAIFRGWVAHVAAYNYCPTPTQAIAHYLAGRP